MSDAVRIAALRARVDAVDDAIVALLAERAAVVAELWEEKRAAGAGVRDPDREAAVFARLRAVGVDAGLDPDAVEEVFRGIVGVALTDALAARAREP